MLINPPETQASFQLLPSTFPFRHHECKSTSSSSSKSCMLMVTQTPESRAAQELLKIPDLKQLFFDCDNTLAQTEGLAFTVTADLVNELLETKGIADRYVGAQLIIHFIGLTFKQMMPQLAKRHKFVLTPEDFAHFSKREEEEVIKVIQKDGKACTGSMEVLTKLKAEKKYHIAVVSSSSTARITATLTKTDQLKFFTPETIYSAQTSLEQPKGKPEPDIYLHALKKLGMKAEQCLTVEDSRVGAISAIEAGIPCIGYVGCYNGKAKQIQLESDFEELGCVTTMWSWDEYEGILSRVTMK